MIDFKDIIDYKAYDKVDTLMNLFQENKDLLIKINFEQFINNINIPNDLKLEIINKFWELKNFFNSTWEKIDLWIEKLKDLDDKATKVIHQGLDTLFDK